MLEAVGGPEVGLQISDDDKQQLELWLSLAMLATSCTSSRTLWLWPLSRLPRRPDDHHENRMPVLV